MRATDEIGYRNVLRRTNIAAIGMLSVDLDVIRDCFLKSRRFASPVTHPIGACHLKPIPPLIVPV